MKYPYTPVRVSKFINLPLSASDTERDEGRSALVRDDAPQNEEEESWRNRTLGTMVWRTPKTTKQTSRREEIVDAVAMEEKVGIGRV